MRIGARSLSNVDDGYESGAKAGRRADGRAAGDIQVLGQQLGRQLDPLGARFAATIIIQQVFF